MYTDEKSSKELELERVYDKKYMMSLGESQNRQEEQKNMLDLIGRALVDSTFFSFVGKLPKLLETYANKELEQRC